MDAVAANGLINDIELLSLGRGYDYPVVRQRLAGYGLHQLDIPLCQPDVRQFQLLFR